MSKLGGQTSNRWLAALGVDGVRQWFQDNLLRRLFRNVGILLSGDVAASLFGLIYLVLTTRALGATHFGILVLVQTYVNVVDRLVGFQTWQALIKYGAEVVDEQHRERFKGMVKLGTLLDVSSAVLGAVIAASAAFWIGPWLGWDSQIIHMAACYSVSILFRISATPVGIIRLYDQFQVFASQRMISEGFKLLAVTAAYLTGAGLWTYVIIWMATNVIRHLFLFAAGHYLLYRRQVLRWWQARTDGLRPFVTFNCWSSLATTLDIPVKQLDVFIISSVLSLEAVGIYRVFKDIAQVINKVADPIYQAIYPQFAALVAQADARRAAKMAVKLGVILIVASTPVVLAISFSSPWWLRVFFGQVFASQWLVLSGYLAYQTVSLAFQGLHPLFIAMGYIRKNFFILALANAGFVLCAWHFGSNRGLIGIVLALAVQFSIVVLLKIFYLRRGLHKTL
jgi:O-antigen/teichoic acid export membrane protein